eukprot:CAMPEP_0202724916 /NCGR_PEP_ID=MMETSP1385-20130828/177684_1 /ASSEMBLY_ACC=CAM_ASM_000861 /TAXON_ID=933848 /ORGANISM="Elphidium margaritaceum" /LENGTH=440 /DNA_ID=CAMNT_0049390717 /DNA_START=356 /DNA_END=1675 /DNA_ORIENTATION=-
MECLINVNGCQYELFSPSITNRTLSSITSEFESILIKLCQKANVALPSTHVHTNRNSHVNSAAVLLFPKPAVDSQLQQNSSAHYQNNSSASCSSKHAINHTQVQLQPNTTIAALICSKQQHPHKPRSIHHHSCSHAHVHVPKRHNWHQPISSSLQPPVFGAYSRSTYPVACYGPVRSAACYHPQYYHSNSHYHHQHHHIGPPPMRHVHYHPYAYHPASLAHKPATQPDSGVLCFESVLAKYVRSKQTIKYGEAGLVDLTGLDSTDSEQSKQSEQVCNRFHRWMNASGRSVEILKLYKICNDKLKTDYQYRRQSILRGLDCDRSKLHEQCLYHGTNIHVVPKIITQGFLRQFTTRYQYGQGCYFAAHPAYSANPRYAAPNAHGVQFMFVCSVVCGEWCLGNPSMKVPDIKPGTNNILYESTCNDVQQPSIFVTFNDNQAIP